MINNPTLASVEASFISENAIHAMSVRLTGGAVSAMHRVAVGIFDRSGRAKRVGTFETYGTRLDKVNLSLPCSLSTDDHVLVACNAPSDLFEGYIPDEAAFRGRTMAVDEALGGSSLSNADVCLPLFGETRRLTQGVDASFNAEVELHSLMAKITLDSLDIRMRSIDDHSGGTLFAPDRLLLVNVPERLSFGGAADTKHLGHGDMTHYGKLGFHGHMCLGTSGVSGSNGRRYFRGLSLFVPACENMDASCPLMLVALGEFSPFGPGQMQIPVCFPLSLGTVEGGKHYHVSAEVNDIGNGVTYDTLGNPLFTPLDPVNNTVRIEASALGEE